MLIDNVVLPLKAGPAFRKQVLSKPDCCMQTMYGIKNQVLIAFHTHKPRCLLQLCQFSGFINNRRHSCWRRECTAVRSAWQWQDKACSSIGKCCRCSVFPCEPQQCSLEVPGNFVRLWNLCRHVIFWRGWWQIPLTAVVGSCNCVCRAKANVTSSSCSSSPRTQRPA